MPVETPKILTLYLQIAQYPILSRQIRQRMREELYRRGVTTVQHFEQEARAKAIDSQHREGLLNPYLEEAEEQWEQRLQHVRDNLTDFYFAYNLPLDLFHRIVQELVTERGVRPTPQVRLTFNPELAPVDLLLRQLRLYDALPEAERANIQHHIEQIVVVLTRTIISDQLSFVRVAKAWFNAADFEYIRAQRIGTGKIGGKAAGILLAWKILQRAAPELAARVSVPRSYFVGANVFYDFKAINQLEHNQKYKSADDIRSEYPAIQEAHLAARFPEEVADRLRQVLDELGPTPVIVRSSSLLEDNFGTSFAGKYASYFCPNQGSPRENLRDLTEAIRRIYASVYNPDVLIYRRRMGLLDYDERMAILLQEVQGAAHGRYFYPDLAGVAFSRSSIVWSPRLRREEGFVRLVNGLGTRAVDRVAEDYPRMIFLSHPLLRPESTARAIAHYSQHYVDVIDLAENTFTTVPAREVLKPSYEAVRWLASLSDSGSDTRLPLHSLPPQLAPERLVLTFDSLLQRSDFVPLLKEMLAVLARHYQQPVDMEFAATVGETGGKPATMLHLLQCRPQSSLGQMAARALPADVSHDSKLFCATRMVPQGEVNKVEYILYVDPACYSRVPDNEQRMALARLIGRLNKSLEGKHFILVGPGRWGSSNLQLGVPVSYGDIYNARALVELSVGPQGLAPDPSYGTHFFQDLVESQIYSLAVHTHEQARESAEAAEFINWAFLQDSRNALLDVLPDADAAGCLKVVHIPSERAGQLLEIWMDGEKGLAFFKPSAA